MGCVSGLLVDPVASLSDSEAVRTGNVRYIAVTQGDQELHLSTEAEVRVEIIIQCTVGDQVLRVHRTTKAFECIVAGEADHDIIDGSSVANASRV